MTKKTTASPRPHFKWAKGHRDDCGCYSCRIWRQSDRGWRMLERLNRAERKN